MTSPGVPDAGPDLPDDVALLRLLAQGNEIALGPLHRRYAGRILALARHHGLSNPEQAVEDAFVLLYRSAGCFPRSSLDAPTWITALAHWHFRRASAPVAASSERRRAPFSPTAGAEPTSTPDG